jgi:hypothetical protein
MAGGSAATEQLTTSQPSAGADLLRPLVKGGPTHILKLLKLSSIESGALREKQVELRRMILSLDKITRLIFSYAKGRLKSAAGVGSEETAVLARRTERRSTTIPAGIRCGLSSVVHRETTRNGNAWNDRARTPGS